jgi:hypothetical protein
MLGKIRTKEEIRELKRKDPFFLLEILKIH